MSLTENTDNVLILSWTVPLRRERVVVGWEGRWSEDRGKTREAEQEGWREGWRASHLWCGNGAVLSTGDSGFSCSPLLIPVLHHTHPTPLTSSPFSPLPRFWIQLQEGRMGVRWGYVGEVDRCTVRGIKWQRRQGSGWMSGSEVEQVKETCWLCSCVCYYLVSPWIKKREKKKCKSVTADYNASYLLAQTVSGRKTIKPKT